MFIVNGEIKTRIELFDLAYLNVTEKSKRKYRLRDLSQKMRGSY